MAVVVQSCLAHVMGLTPIKLMQKNGVHLVSPVFFHGSSILVAFVCLLFFVGEE